MISSVLILALIWAVPIAIGFLACGEVYKLILLHFEAKAYKQILAAREANK